jgi:hypothetical protein
MSQQAELNQIPLGFHDCWALVTISGTRDISFF